MTQPLKFNLSKLWLILHSIRLVVLFSILDYMLGSLTNALESGLRETLREKYQEAMDPYLTMMDVWIVALDAMVYHQTGYGSAAVVTRLRLDQKVCRLSITDADASEMSDIQKDRLLETDRRLESSRARREKISERRKGPGPQSSMIGSDVSFEAHTKLNPTSLKRAALPSALKQCHKPTPRSGTKAHERIKITPPTVIEALPTTSKSWKRQKTFKHDTGTKAPEKSDGHLRKPDTIQLRPKSTRHMTDSATPNLAPRIVGFAAPPALETRSSSRSPSIPDTTRDQSQCRSTPITLLLSPSPPPACSNDIPSLPDTPIQRPYGLHSLLEIEQVTPFKPDFQVSPPRNSLADRSADVKQASEKPLPDSSITSPHPEEGGLSISKGRRTLKHHEEPMVSAPRDKRPSNALVSGSSDEKQAAVKPSPPYSDFSPNPVERLISASRGKRTPRDEGVEQSCSESLDQLQASVSHEEGDGDTIDRSHDDSAHTLVMAPNDSKTESYSASVYDGPEGGDQVEDPTGIDADTTIAVEEESKGEDEEDVSPCKDQAALNTPRPRPQIHSEPSTPSPCASPATSLASDTNNTATLNLIISLEREAQSWSHSLSHQQLISRLIHDSTWLPAPEPGKKARWHQRILNLQESVKTARPSSGTAKLKLYTSSEYWEYDKLLLWLASGMHMQQFLRRFPPGYTVIQAGAKAEVGVGQAQADGRRFRETGDQEGRFMSDASLDTVDLVMRR